jgi:hypothetical protein
MRNVWSMFRFSIGFAAGSLILGGIAIQQVMKLELYDKELKTTIPQTEKEAIEMQVNDFRKDWNKNRKEHLNQMNKEAKEYLKTFDKSSTELPEVVYKIMELLDSP